jgi:lipid II:glycine glycyltransferase (peptidoglycan interpeptide bridge formation enzyme)
MTDVTIRFAEGEADMRAWNQFALDCPLTSFFVTSNWLDSYSSFGVKPRYLLASNGDDQVIAGAALGEFRAGPIRWMEVIHSPAFLPDRATFTVVRDLIDSIDAYARQIGASHVRVSPFEAAPYRADAQTQAERSNIAYDPELLSYTRQGVTDVLSMQGFQPLRSMSLLPVPLQGQLVSLKENNVVTSFGQDTRRKIRLTEKAGVTVRKAETLEDIRAAYEVIASTGSHKGYAVRPWEAFKQAASLGIQWGTATVLLAELHEEIVSASLVQFGGRRGVYGMGGTYRKDFGKNVYGGQFVQYHAMLECLARGYGEYDLTAVTEGSVQQFKAGFKTTLYRLVDPLTKVYKPVEYRAYLSLLPQLRTNRRRIALLLHRLSRLRHRR